MGAFDWLFGRKKVVEDKNREKETNFKEQVNVDEPMTYKDIHFYINNRRVGTPEIIGAQPDMAFFDQIKEHLHGECIITFQVGEQRVENRVVVNKTEFKVENNFIPFDIEGFVEQEKERVRKEQEEANFSDELIDVYFIPARTLLACEQTFPAFDRSKLVKDPEGQKFFVSHRWLTVEHPDPEGKHLALLKKHADSHRDAFYWIDFSCLPQSRNAEDERFFRNTLPKIASIQSKSSTIMIMEADYNNRLWCYIEHFTGVLFSQTNFGSLNKSPRTIEYIWIRPDDDSMIDKVQTLEEPAWDKLKVTNPSDIPGIKYNYKWVSNLVKFQLYDRFSELQNTLPGHEIYSGDHYFQSAFGIQYAESLEQLRSLFFEFGGDIQYFYNSNSLLWLAERFSWSVSPDSYKIEQFHFSKYLFFSEDMVGWVAMLLGIIKLANRGNDKIMNFRDLYAKIVLMSLYK